VWDAGGGEKNPRLDLTRIEKPSKKRTSATGDTNSPAQKEKRKNHGFVPEKKENRGKGGSVGGAVAGKKKRGGGGGKGWEDRGGQGTRTVGNDERGKKRNHREARFCGGTKDDRSSPPKGTWSWGEKGGYGLAQMVQGRWCLKKTWGKDGSGRRPKEPNLTWETEYSGREITIGKRESSGGEATVARAVHGRHGMMF